MKVGWIFQKLLVCHPRLPGNYTAIGGSSNTSSIISPTVLNPGPYFCIGASILDTYYSYQTGRLEHTNHMDFRPERHSSDWQHYPRNNDKVIILSGRTVTLPADISTLNS